MGFLDRSSERHFNERPYLNHDCYLYLIKTTRQCMARRSDFPSLVQDRLVPKEMTDREGINAFSDAVDQFGHIASNSGLFSIVRLTEEEFLGKDNEGGLLDCYLSLERDKPASLEDLSLRVKDVRIDDKMLCLHILSSTEDLPTSVSTDRAFEKLSTDKSSCHLSFGSPVGLLLSYNHIYNQYLFIPDGEEAKKRFESTACNTHSLARYSRINAVDEEWTHEYLNVAIAMGISPIRVYFNVLAWSDNE